MNLADFVRRAEELVRDGDVVLRTERSGPGLIPTLDEGSFSGFRASSLSFLKNVFGTSHPYYTDFDTRCKENYPDNGSAGRAILRSVLGELQGGWLNSARGLLSAEIFADFLEMADHLLEQNYKDAAAVIIGSVLEEHLRQLCNSHGISTLRPDQSPKKADTLNSELAGANVYNKLDQKNATGWLDLRNKAAHGKYGEYNKQQVEFMRQAVGEFMARHPI